MEDQEQAQTVDPVALTGRKLDLYGVDGNVFCVGIDGAKEAYEVVEDESDGYRSSMERLQKVATGDKAFSPLAIAAVTLQPAEGTEDFDWKMVGEDGYVWLEFGTANADDYYPSFVFNFHPRATP